MAESLLVRHIANDTDFAFVFRGLLADSAKWKVFRRDAGVGDYALWNRLHNVTDIDVYFDSKDTQTKDATATVRDAPMEAIKIALLKSDCF